MVNTAPWLLKFGLGLAWTPVCVEAISVFTFCNQGQTPSAFGISAKCVAGALPLVCSEALGGFLLLFCLFSGQMPKVAFIMPQIFSFSGLV